MADIESGRGVAAMAGSVCHGIRRVKGVTHPGITSRANGSIERRIFS